MIPYGGNNFKRRLKSSESSQKFCSKKFMHTPGKGLYKSCIKHCEISNFGFWHFFFCRLTWESVESCKCAISCKPLVVKRNGPILDLRGTF